MYGASEVADLQPIDQERVGIYINQAYRECYSPVDGKRPTWAKVHFGIELPAPLSTTFSVTKGDKAVGFSDALSSDYEGSFAKIGTKWFMLAYIEESAGITGELVTPWPDDTDATISATVYYSSHRLDREVVDVDMVPEVIGQGPLAPMPSPEVAIRARASYSHDFLPGRHFGKIPTIKHNNEEFDVARPMFYFIDNSALRMPNTTSEDAGLQNMEEMAVRSRFNVQPLPDEAYSIRGTANILPHELTEDGDKARLPGNVVWDILFPISMAKLALTDPRYNGDNKEAVSRTAEEARARLKTFTNAQKHRNIRMVKRAGY